MKELKNELRMWFAEKLLSWSNDVTPWNEEGQKLRIFIAAYYLQKIEELKQ
tara:strand:- start:266 stop:418 length:153 start_codon:yes stop_codon:yes gene_type:complete